MLPWDENAENCNERTMNFRKYILSLISYIFFAFPHNVSASPWALIANGDDSGLYTVDLGTSPASIFGPHLGAQLNPASSIGLFDVEVSPNGKFALVSNFTARQVYRVDISNPELPTLVASIPTGSMFAEDIAISPDGRWAIVSDGGASRDVFFIDLLTNVATQFTLAEGYAQAVAISPDGRTVVMIDYFGGKVIYGQVNSSRNGLINVTDLPLPTIPDAPPMLIGPVNVTFSPRGDLILVAAVGSQQIIPFTLDNGSLSPGAALDLPAAPQSIAFSPTQPERAYALLSGVSTPAAAPQVVELHVGAGEVSLSGRAVDTLGTSTAQLFGVDTLAISTDGRYAIASNTSNNGAATDVMKIDLRSFEAIPLGLNSEYPAGVAFIPTFSVQPIPALGPWSMALMALLTIGIARAQRFTSKKAG